MGTLYSQDSRDWHRLTEGHLDNFLSYATELAGKHKIAVSDVIAAARVLELRRANDLYVSNGDIHDEQIAGIGEELRGIAEAIVSTRGDA